MIVLDVNPNITRLIMHAFSWLVAMPRPVKRAAIIFVDTNFIISCVALALFIRVPDQALLWLSVKNTWLLMGFTVTCIFIWARLGLYRAIIRFMDIRALSTVFVGAVVSSIGLALLSFIGQIELPRSVPIIYFGLILVCVAGSRLVVRGLLDSSNRVTSQKVVIYGAGAAGRQLCVALQNGREFGPIAFVDDDSRLHNARVLGVPVMSPSRLGALVESQKVSKLLFAIPSASKAQKSSIFNSIEKLGIEMLTIPSSAELVSGAVSYGTLRSVGIDDLLGRDTVAPSSMLLQSVSGKTVLITGAGGSIGSELARQLSELNCHRIILLEQSEFHLYKIDRELSNGNKVSIVPVLGSVLDERLLHQLFGKYGVDLVYHAAAYKHVPLVEQNSAVGFINNVRGTQCVAEIALKYSVDRFVLISSDKAVRPTNVMGASKRLSELIVQNFAKQSRSSVFSMVRFGNVLGSSGSVVPVFESQVERGGPVTVTHPEITRYFMPIPEAAALVLQAGAMASGGEVFVLDMGQPIKVLDLAYKIIRLMGASVRDEENPDGEISI